MKRRFISSLLAVGMISSAFAGMTITANAADYTSTLQLNETVKFDFGAAGQTAADGYVSVTPDMYYFADDATYGFLGISENSFNESRDHDGFSVVKGQYTVPKAGGTADASNANSDYIAVPAASEYLPEGASTYEGRYPIRFAMKVDRQSYYTVKVTLANASASVATSDVTLMTEKRHIIDNNIVIPAGGTKEYTFNVDVEDVYYKADYIYSDEMLNIEVMGENAAIASMEVTRITPGVTIWACDDSTGCDQPGIIPYFQLATYAGVAQELSKYVPASIAISNQGEGGLASGDNQHLNKCNLKAGDYLYVEYGHNESGTDNYKSNLEKYYTKAKAADATLLIVSAVERHNHFDSSTQEYTSGFGGYITAGKAFVDEKIAEDGANAKIAFVDLNSTFITWQNQETARINGINSNISREKAIEFYYRSVKGSGIDVSHINDAGADQAARAVLVAAQAVYDAGKDAAAGTNAKIQSDAVAGIVNGWQSSKTAYQIPDAVINAGTAPNSYWDAAVTAGIPYKNEVAISDVTVENGSLTAVSTRVMNGGLSYYGRAVVNVTSGGTTTTYYSTKNIDNTAAPEGTVTTFTDFNTDISVHNTDTTNAITIPDGATVTVQIFAANIDTDWTIVNDTPYSALYTVRNAAKTVFADNGGVGSWTFKGGAGHTETYVTDTASDDDAPYMHLTATPGSSASYTLYKSLGSDNYITGGIINVKAKLRVQSGYLFMSLPKTAGSNNWFTDYTDVLAIKNGAVSSNGTDIITDTDETNHIKTGMWFDFDCILDLDAGTMQVSVGGSDYKTIAVPNYAKNDSSLLPIRYFGFRGDNSNGFEADIKDIKVTQLERTGSLGTVTVNAAANNADFGSVKIDGETATSKAVEVGSGVTLTAVPADGYYLKSWTDASGNTLSTDAAYSLSRVVEGFTATANFESIYGEGYTVKKFIDEDFEGETNVFGMSIADVTSNYSANAKVGHPDKSKTNTFTLSEAANLTSKQFMELTFNIFTTYHNNGGNNTFAIYDNNDKEIVSFTYNKNDCKVTAIKVGGTTIDGFEQFAFRCSKSDAGASSGDRGTFGAVTIKINGDKTVEMSFNGASYSNAAKNPYKGTLTDDVSINSIKITADSADRAILYDNFKGYIVTSPYEHHSYTINAVDENGDVIKALDSGVADETRTYSTPVLNEVISNGTSFYRLNDSDVSGYVKSFTMGTEDAVQTVTYRKNSNIVAYKEGESFGTASASATASGGQKGHVNGSANAEFATLPAGSYKAYVAVISDGGRGVYFRDKSNTDNGSNTIKSTNSTGTVEFTLAAETTIGITGYTTSSSGLNQSAEIDYIIIEKVATPLQNEVSETGNTTISGTYDGEDAEIPANTTVTIAENASITNGTLTAAESGKITVVVGDSTISNASSVQFDSEGKVTPADGAVISTTNSEGKTDKGFFVTKTVAEGADKVTFTINNKEYAGTIEGKSGSVLFGIFVTGIPADTDVTVK